MDDIYDISFCFCCPVMVLYDSNCIRSKHRFLSFFEVLEDEALIANVKDKFESLNKPEGDGWRYPIQQFPFGSTFIDNLEEPSTLTSEMILEGQSAIHSSRTKDCNLIANHMMPMYMIQDFCNTSMRQGTDTLGNASGCEYSQHSLGLIHVAGSSCHLSCEDYTSLIAKDCNVDPYSDNFERRIYGNIMNELKDIHFDEGVVESISVINDFDSGIYDSGNNFLGFSEDCELQKAAEAAVMGNPYEGTYGMGISSHDVDYWSNGNVEPQYTMSISGGESVGFHMKELEVEHLLEAFLTNSSNSSDNHSSNNSDLTCFSMPSEKHLTSSKRRRQSEDSASLEHDKLPSNFSASGLTGLGTISASNLSSSVSSFRNNVCELNEKPPHRKGSDSLKVGKLSRPSYANKRRSHAGNNQRSRPRDRQLIQERIKELRELVPNSEKCSIDGLLDKTLQHMLFLRSVTDQADKLRQQEDFEEETDRKTERTGEANYSHQNGTSWAVELGSDQKLCPIVVKDLDRPGHMLIEMLCSDHGRFLQIADVIHRSQLTILKGVMEKCSHNPMARFIVETSGSFHRLDIFWPLMKLLQ
ncbi:transcription factor EMB1444-like isoform X2 [Andrographis paniculata]|uniref:transcription factor EMB1444-like isoform X2 n=1 Tax=Andrographis paniculata TaxID=175694 RepID=UPI0021E80C49|nr:transcription factor EMB1444-like isoform X2 [Andrographis paniculata]